MSMAEAAEDGARVHWLVAGGFTAAPAGKRFKVTPDSLAEAMVAAKLGGKVTVADRLGGGDTRSFDVAFSKPKAFQLSELIATTPALQGLRQLAEDFGSTDPTKRPAPEVAIAKIAELVGAGKLTAAVEAATRPAGAPAPSAPAGSAATGSVDAIFSGADVAKGPTAVSAVDSFVKAIRPTSDAKPATNSTAAKTVRTAIEDAVYATARDILADPAMARIEAAWRGLRLIVDQAPTSAGMSIEVLDTTPAALIEALRTAMPEDAIDQYDAVFVTDAIDDVDKLTALADLGEELNSPVIVGVTHAFFGAGDPHVLSSRIEEDRGGAPEKWDVLRASESSRWLAVVTNRMVLAADGTGSARRVAFGNPVFALAAMLGASYRLTGSFARIIGQTGGLKAPGTAELTTGREAGNAIPTEAFMSLRAQTRLGTLGIIGLGSGRNTDVVALSTVPTVRGGEDLVPLPAQILTGRTVRFAQWVAMQVTAGMPDRDVCNLFEQAAGVFLFPGSTEGAGLRAQIVEYNKEKGRGVLLTASVKAEHAGTPFHLAFTLPIPK